MTPLHYALNINSTEIVRLLLEHGADPNVPEKVMLCPQIVCILLLLLYMNRTIKLCYMLPWKISM